VFEIGNLVDRPYAERVKFAMGHGALVDDFEHRGVTADDFRNRSQRPRP